MPDLTHVEASGEQSARHDVQPLDVTDVRRPSFQIIESEDKRREALRLTLWSFLVFCQCRRIGLEDNMRAGLTLCSLEPVEIKVISVAQGVLPTCSLGLGKLSVTAIVSVVLLPISATKMRGCTNGFDSSGF